MLTPEIALGFITKYCEFYDVVDEQTFYSAVKSMGVAVGHGFVPEFEVRAGCTKGVFLFEDADFVVKIPFRQYCSWSFIHANNAKNEWDYCLREVEVYNAACEAGVGELFARTYLAEYVGGLPVYIQERVTNIGNYEMWDEDYNNAPMVVKAQANRLYSTALSGKAGFDRMTVTALVKDYGLKIARTLMELCCAENLGHDWHSGNYGTNYDTGKLVLCDYSGFRD